MPKSSVLVVTGIASGPLAGSSKAESLAVAVAESSRSESEPIVASGCGQLFSFEGICARAVVRIPGKKSSKRRGKRTLLPNRVDVCGGAGTDLDP
jgi:hypothetical protein